MRLESSPLMLKHSFRTEQELRCKEKAQMVRLLGFFDVHIRPKKYSYKKAPHLPINGKWGIFRGRISRRSILSNINTLVARIDLPRGAAEISNYVEFYTIRAVSDPIPQAINYE